MAHEADTLLSGLGTNGDLPTDIIEQTVSNLIAAADQARARRDALKAQYDEANYLCVRLERAVRDLTAPKPEGKAKKPGPKAKGAGRSQAGADYAPGQPMVGQERLEVILKAIEDETKAEGGPVGTARIAEVTGISRQSISAGFAHLRHRGLIRNAGQTRGGGHLVAPWHGEGEGAEDER